MNIRQKQYNVLRQPVRSLESRIDIIDNNESIIGSFTGIIVDGNISINSNSIHRRSGNISMVLDEKYNLIPSPSSKIWLNRRCAISIGVKDFSGEIIWFDLGRFAMCDIQLDFQSDSKKISCTLKDYMAFLDGTLSGNLSHKILIEAGSVTISEAIRYIVRDLPRVSIDNITIDDKLSKILPYELEKKANTSIASILKELVELYMNYEMYFDKNGYFIVKKINNGKHDAIVEYFNGDDGDFSISQNIRMDFTNVKNSIYVWGFLDDDGEQYQAVMRNCGKVADFKDLSVIKATDGDIYYVNDEDKSYMYKEKDWQLCDFNVNPIFSIDEVGEKILAIENDKVFDNEQARLRAEFELEKYSNLNEEIDIKCVPLYYLDVNHKIYVDTDNMVNGEYLINSISIKLSQSGTMDIKAKKIYK